MSEILHIISSKTRSEWTPTFFDTTNLSTAHDPRSCIITSTEIFPPCSYDLSYLHRPFWGKQRDVKSSPQHPSFRAKARPPHLGPDGAALAAHLHTPHVGPLLGHESACPSRTGLPSLNNLETWFGHLRNPYHLDLSLKDEIVNPRNCKTSKWSKCLTEDN